MNRGLTVALGLSLLLALILRVPDLDLRPFHNDEAVNALKFRDLLEQGTYRYDPNEYHGPLLHYATLIFARATAWPSFEATTEASFRWLTVLFGAALILLLWITRDALGRSGTLWAAVLTAISPSLVFFSRDYIHEMLLVVFSFLFIGCLWRYSRQPNWRWALGAGAAVGLMHATKETFVLNLAALGIAGGLLCLWQRTTPCGNSTSRRRCLGHGAILLGAWAAIALMLFSSLGQNPDGPADSLRTYLPWLTRAGGDSPHMQPCWFYAERLFWWNSGGTLPWTELGILLFALVGCAAALTGRGLGDAHAGFVRWLGLYTLILFVTYSLIPYKTPWCILGAAHGMVLLAGVGAGVLWRSAWKLPHRIALAVITSVVLGYTCWQGWALSHSRVSARDNPWAYADTAPDIQNLIDRVDQLAATSARRMDMNIQVICNEDDYWPLPYSFRNYSRVGWWSEWPPLPLAPVLIVSPGMAASFDPSSTYVNTGSFQLREGVFRTCYVEKELWEVFLRARRSG